jgi:hypothetical protein
MRDTTLRYAVVRFGADWRIVDAQGERGQFSCPGQAAAHVGRLAREAVGMGYDVEVLVQSPVGELRYVHVDRTIH